MIELTTGVAFLMSSLYGSGQSDNHVDNIINGEEAITIAAPLETKTESSSFIDDPKAMEAFLRKEYAETPILVDIARCESNFRQFDKDGNVIRGMAVKADIGVMQINETYHGDMAKKLGFNIHTIEGNVAYAKHLYREQGSQPWSASAKCWKVGDAVAKK